MSGVIQLQLATVLATVKDKGRAVWTALNAYDTTTEDDDQLEVLATQLSNATGRAQALVDKWSDFIARLLPKQQQEEMDVLQAFPPPRGEVRENDELTVLAQIERSRELVVLVNGCLQQRRNSGRGSVSSGKSFMTTQSPQQLEEQPELYACPPQSPVEESGCSLCHTGPAHKPSRCPTFNSRQRRKARLLEQGRCLNCLYDGHLLNRCRAANKCGRCGGRHHFMLCIQRQPKKCHHDRSYEANYTQRQPKKRVYYPTGHHNGPSEANWRQPQLKKRVIYSNGHHDGLSEANWQQPQPKKRVFYQTGLQKGTFEEYWGVPTSVQPEVTYSGMVFTSSLSNDSQADTKSSTSSTNLHRRRKVWINSKLKGNLTHSRNGQVTSQPNKASICSTSFSNAGKFLCVTQAVTTAAVTCGITAAATEGITESATEQITRNCSTAAETNECATRTGITRAAATKINLSSKCISRRRQWKSCSSVKGRHRESPVAECRPSPKVRKRGSSESALHDHHHCFEPSIAPTQGPVNLKSALTRHPTGSLALIDD